MSDRLLTILQTAEQFNLTTGILYAAVARGDLASVRFRPRGHIRLREHDILAWIDGHVRSTHVTPPVAVEMPATRPTDGDISHLLPAWELRRFTR